MLAVQKIDEREVTKWLRWIDELKNDTKKQKEFRTDARELFPEAIFPYKIKQGKTYYIVYAGDKEQLLVKTNWSADIDSINISAILRIIKTERAYVCLKKFIEEIISECKEKNKSFIKAKTTTPKGKRCFNSLAENLPNGIIKVKMENEYSRPDVFFFRIGND